MTIPEQPEDNSASLAELRARADAPEPSPDTNEMPFQSFNPCTNAAAYVTTPKTISFRTCTNGYSPACLKVPKGTLVNHWTAGSLLAQ